MKLWCSILCALGSHDWRVLGRLKHGCAIRCFDCGRSRFKPAPSAAAKYGGGLWLSPAGPKGTETFDTGEELDG